MEGIQYELLYHPTTDEPYIRASDLVEGLQAWAKQEDRFMLADRDAFVYVAVMIEYIAKNAVRRPGPVIYPRVVAVPVLVPVHPVWWIGL